MSQLISLLKKCGILNKIHLLRKIQCQSIDEILEFDQERRLFMESTGFTFLETTLIFTVIKQSFNNIPPSIDDVHNVAMSDDDHLNVNSESNDNDNMDIIINDEVDVDLDNNDNNSLMEQFFDEENSSIDMTVMTEQTEEANTKSKKKHRTFKHNYDLKIFSVTDPVSGKIINVPFTETYEEPEEIDYGYIEPVIVERMAPLPDEKQLRDEEVCGAYTEYRADDKDFKYEQRKHSNLHSYESHKQKHSSSYEAPSSSKYHDYKKEHEQHRNINACYNKHQQRYQQEIEFEYKQNENNNYDYNRYQYQHQQQHSSYYHQSLSQSSYISSTHKYVKQPRYQQYHQSTNEEKGDWKIGRNQFNQYNRCVHDNQTYSRNGKWIPFKSIGASDANKRFYIQIKINQPRNKTQPKHPRGCSCKELNINNKVLLLCWFGRYQFTGDDRERGRQYKMLNDFWRLQRFGNRDQNMKAYIKYLCDKIWNEKDVKVWSDIKKTHTHNQYYQYKPYQNGTIIYHIDFAVNKKMDVLMDQWNNAADELTNYLTVSPACYSCLKPRRN